MGWNDWSYWLRGGLIGNLVSLLVIPLLFWDPLSIWTDAILYVYFPTTIYYFTGGSPAFLFGSRPLPGTFIVFMINGFVYGAIIGWLYGKWKNRGSAVSE